MGYLRSLVHGVVRSYWEGSLLKTYESDLQSLDMMSYLGGVELLHTCASSSCWIAWTLQHLLLYPICHFLSSPTVHNRYYTFHVILSDAMLCLRIKK